MAIKIKVEGAKRAVKTIKQRTEEVTKMEDGFKAMEENTAKIISNCKIYRDRLDKGILPSHHWVLKNMLDSEKGTGIGTFMGCNQYAIFQIYSIEFIQQLAQDILNLKPKKVIEVAAGDGRLSYFLNRYGVNSIPSDNRKWGLVEDTSSAKPKHMTRHITYPTNIEKLTYLQAIKKHKPDLVIICWEELNAKFTQEILNKGINVIWIGEPRGCCGHESTFELDHEFLNSQYCLCRTDYAHAVKTHKDLGLLKHSNVILFKSK